MRFVRRLGRRRSGSRTRSVFKPHRGVLAPWGLVRPLFKECTVKILIALFLIAGAVASCSVLQSKVEGATSQRVAQIDAAVEAMSK